MNKLAFMVVVVFLGVFALPAQLQAATVPAMDLDELTKVADAIVLGSVESVESSLRDGRVYTDVVIRIEDTLKGDLVETVTIRHLGGKTDELATYVPGMPSFTQGERSLLFLEKTSASTWVTVGLALGKWAVSGAGESLKVHPPNAVGLKLMPLDRPTKALKDLSWIELKEVIVDQRADTPSENEK